MIFLLFLDGAFRGLLRGEARFARFGRGGRVIADSSWLWSAVASRHVPISILHLYKPVKSLL